MVVHLLLVSWVGGLRYRTLAAFTVGAERRWEFAAVDFLCEADETLNGASVRHAD